MVRPSAATLRRFVLLAGSCLAWPAAAEPVKAPPSIGTAVLYGLSGPVVQLDEVTVLADRRPESPITMLGSASVVTGEEIDRFDPNSFEEVLGTIPGVEAAPRDDDPGVSPNIRGLQDFGRVAVLVDGARQNFQVSGHNANGAFYVEPALLAGVDITRGPIANAYGSGAIGGVLSMRTLGIPDLLDEGERYGARFGATLGSNGPNALGTAEVGAFLLDALDVYSALAIRSNEDYTDGRGTVIDNTGFDVVSGLVKGRFRPAAGHEIEVSALLYGTDFISDTAGSTERDTEVEMSTYRAGYTFDSPDTDLINFKAGAYKTTTEYAQTILDGTGRTRSVDVETTGFDVNNTSVAALSDAISMTFTYGVDAFRDEVKSEDEFGTTELFTPGGRREVHGGFAQALLEYGELIDLTVGARYDDFTLDDGTDGTSGERLSPKVSLGVTPVTGLQVYALYAEGLRAPALSEAVVSGLHPAPAAFEFIPNPSLKPEIGKTMEGGVNLSLDGLLVEGDAFRLKAAIYRNDVYDYIGTESLDRPGVVNPCVAPGPRGRCFARLPFDAITYVNLDEVRIEGAELEAGYDWVWGFAGVATTHSEGRDRISGDPLDTIFPDRVTATLGLRAFDRKLTYGGRLHLVDGKEENEVTDPSFAADGYGLLDLFASYEPNKDVRIDLSVKNVFDRRYVEYSGGPAIESFSAPGFEAKIGARIKFASSGGLF